MTNEEFRAGRHKLGLTLSELGRVLNVDARTIRKWEAPNEASTARSPNPIAARVMQWMLDGWRPPEWPGEK